MRDFLNSARETGRKVNHVVNLGDAIGCILLGGFCVFMGVVLDWNGNSSVKWLPPVLVIGGVLWALHGVKGLRRVGREGR
jgi:hypothetical protein